MAKIDPQFEEGYQLPESVPEPQALTEREQALRNLFVAEYLVDFDQTAAAMRCGFNRQFAIEYGTKFMAEPYVLKKINSVKFQDVDVPEDQDDYDAKRVRSALMLEAHYRGPGSSHAARVAALAKLASLIGMDKPIKTEQTVNHRGGVMAVPGIASLDDWEKAASESQDALVKDARL
jgi:hypothetical protein